MKTVDIQLTQIDELGTLLATIADLTAKADAIKDGLKDAATAPGGSNVFEGNLFKATVVESNRSTVDYKAIMAKYKIPAEVVAEYTKTTAVFSVKTTAR
jgi:hypothetical protein